MPATAILRIGVCITRFAVVLRNVLDILTVYVPGRCSLPWRVEPVAHSQHPLAISPRPGQVHGFLMHAYQRDWEVKKTNQRESARNIQDRAEVEVLATWVIWPVSYRTTTQQACCRRHRVHALCCISTRSNKRTQDGYTSDHSAIRVLESA